ncbi:phenylacetyl-CoA:acceptor oxidoreductase PadC subunit [Humidesulfovibrio mexicanus]|uniref:Phenylacetyl-CoA:acceptor oxidoreductase PadC subunit n=1 Tax=Humidesulfovibrio mexicanus TaxID=147047 RepID=A0A239CHM4_9BACT|nr:4Fe-4S dicluster domain-containing protein [Humidesulfovibrio mexicanus]SNS19620.1 phenylacetyl-CoA:acceptor oxidoreductase PadC subunit [Humidesulfovibrio mexicanus]
MNDMQRRDILKAGAVLGGAVALGKLAAGSAVLAGETEAKAGAPAVLERVKPAPGEDVHIRMQRELVRAMKKPLAERRWGMVIDTRKCVGCHSCTVGCVMENKLPPGVVYRPVIDMESGAYPNVGRKFLPRPCMQCENPPCVPVCPVKATWKRADGIIVIDYDACIGCRYCITACPYQARTYDFGQNFSQNAASGKDGGLALDTGRKYEKEPSFEYGSTWTRGEGLLPKSPVGNARKCTFCAHRLEHYQLPMCVSTCIGRSTFFGDMNDPKSLVAGLVARNNAVLLKGELGTAPKVFYLV